LVACGVAQEIHEINDYDFVHLLYANLTLGNEGLVIADLTINIKKFTGLHFCLSVVCDLEVDLKLFHNNTEFFILSFVISIL
jgi:hypothetical protein